MKSLARIAMLIILDSILLFIYSVSPLPEGLLNIGNQIINAKTEGRALIIYMFIIPATLITAITWQINTRFLKLSTISFLITQAVFVALWIALATYIFAYIIMSLF